MGLVYAFSIIAIISGTLIFSHGVFSSEPGNSMLLPLIEMSFGVVLLYFGTSFYLNLYFSRFMAYMAIYFDRPITINAILNSDLIQIDKPDFNIDHHTS